MTDGDRWADAVLAVGVVNGLASGALLAVEQPVQVGVATDVYYHAARALLEGGQPYAVTPPGLSNFHFLYPPLVLLAMAPFGLLGGTTAAYALQTVVSLAAGLALGRLLVRTVAAFRTSDGAGASRRTRLLLYAYALGSFSAASTLVMGQVNLVLAAGLAAGALALEPAAAPAPVRGWSRRRRETLAGALFAAVATVKLFPALFG
ncbi:MAG: glycosyltransferase family 87 protein, partial [Halobacteriaceae archaeon]